MKSSTDCNHTDRLLLPRELTFPSVPPSRHSMSMIAVFKALWLWLGLLNLSRGGLPVCYVSFRRRRLLLTWAEWCRDRKSWRRAKFFFFRLLIFSAIAFWSYYSTVPRWLGSVRGWWHVSQVSVQSVILNCFSDIVFFLLFSFSYKDDVSRRTGSTSLQIFVPLCWQTNVDLAFLCLSQAKHFVLSIYWLVRREVQRKRRIYRNGLHIIAK